MTEPLVDKYGRKHEYLRISVTDRCNLRCVYCMGSEGVKLIKHEDILRYEEIVKVVQAATQLGISKIRLTGGEPLVRKGIEGLVRQIALIPGIQDLAMTTNGQLLAEKLPALKEAGLKRINISLDSLDPHVYKEITRGGDLSATVEGIKASLEAGLNPVKINVVLMKGINDREIASFLELARRYPLHLRFIEYMPIDSHDQDWRGKYLPLEIVKTEARRLGYHLLPLEVQHTNGPAEMFRVQDGRGKVGLIHPISRHFCASCNRLRLTADGYLKPCLYWPEEIPLRPYIDDPKALLERMRQAIDNKKERHDMDKLSAGERTAKRRGMSAIGG